jgi:histidine triad (HIT) family protein
LSTIFTKIINGEIPCYKIAEDQHFIAFLDVFPLQEGHTLVVPKVEIDKLHDLPDEYLNGMLRFAKPIAQALEKSFPGARTGYAVIGLEVPHAHLHLVPISSAADIDFTRPKMKLSMERMESIATHIRSFIS